MKFRNLTTSMFLAALIVFNFQSTSAQTVSDTVVLGAGYASQCYYDLSGGTKNYTPVDNWSLAFETNNLQSGSIWVNEAIGMKAYLYPKGDTAVFGTSLDTTGIEAWPALHNSLEKWTTGALSNNSTGPFDYGWGNYDQTSHAVYGDSVYVLKVNDSTYYQFTVNFEDQYVYSFTFAGLDGSNATNDSIVRADYAGKNFAYYDLASKQDLDKEPATSGWDLLFSKSLTTQEVTPGYFVNSGGMTYLNFGQSGLKLSGVNTSITDYSGYSLSDTNMTVIGDSYRYFPQPSGPWTITDSTVYFVQAQNSNVYKLVFTSFEGTGTGVITFNKTDVTPSTGIDEVNSINLLNLYPNPVEKQLQVVLAPADAGKVSMSIVNLQGRVVWTQSQHMSSGLQQINIPVEDLASGVYVLAVNNGNSLSRQKFIKY